ncbi:MAG: hypothetical protein WBF95_01965 [Comamonas thiooxydans]
MTVIAYFSDISIAAADLLLSVETPGGPPVLLPSVGSTSNLPPLSLSPTKLVRKILRLKHDKGVAVLLVAGTVSHLKKLVDFFEALRSGALQPLPEFSRGHNTSDPLSVLRTAAMMTEKSGFPNFEFIAFHNGRCLESRHEQHIRLRFSPYFGGSALAGSGASSLYNWLCDRGEKYVNIPSMSRDSVEDKHFRALNLIPSLLLEEDTRVSLKTIGNGVGGYYESFQVDQDGLHPQDAVLTVFASIEKKDKELCLELRRVFFHLYSDDWLFIISLSGEPRILKAGQPLRIDMSEFHIYKVKPLFHDDEPPNWEIPRLVVQMPSAKHWRLTLYRETSTEPQQIKRFYHSQGAEQPILIISVKNQTVSLKIDQERMDYYVKKFPSKTSDENSVKINN